MCQCSVIIVRCTPDGASTFGERIEEMFTGESDEICKRFNRMRAEGFAVVVRPLYNDRFDDLGYEYHEYRSFNGEEFRKVVFKG